MRATTELTASKKIDVSRDTGIGRWNQEIGRCPRHAPMLYIFITPMPMFCGTAWRDFYNHVLALFPRVSMGRPFQEKMAGVVWESENRDAHLQAWKEGRTGVPIVDAGMRQANKMGWMHNRVRMIAAMYLTKDLMIDWRLGEKVSCVPTIPGDGGPDRRPPVLHGDPHRRRLGVKQRRLAVERKHWSRPRSVLQNLQSVHAEPQGT